jgi:hypothetical protein
MVFRPSIPWDRHANSDQELVWYALVDKGSMPPIFLSGVEQAFKRAGLAAKQWRKKYDLRMRGS